ncbi:MAG: GNAT family N-acetyltransferase [Deinococcota bacterium]
MNNGVAYTFHERPPSKAEYINLYQAVGWEKFLAQDHVETLLERSLHHVVALHAETLVGMGRVVGDGAMFFYIQDVAVHPAHQHRGIGQGVTERLVNWCKHNAPPMAFVGLFCAERSKAFYETFSFKANAVGMYQYLGRKE